MPSRIASKTYGTVSADRQKAMQDLMNIGGAAFPFLEAAIKNKDTELETANNCRKILEVLDTRPALQTKKE